MGTLCFLSSSNRVTLGFREPAQTCMEPDKEILAMTITIQRLGRFPDLPAKDAPPWITVNFQPTFHNDRDTDVPSLDCVFCDPPPAEDDGAGGIQKRGRWVASDEGHDGFLLECGGCKRRFDRACFYPHEETMTSKQVVSEDGGRASEVTVPAQVTDDYLWGPFTR